MNVFFRKISKKAMQKHMVFPAIWSGPRYPVDGDGLFPGLSENSSWKNMDVKDIEEYCIKNNLICFYGKGQLSFSKTNN